MSGVVAVLAVGRPDFSAAASPATLYGFRVGSGTVLSSESSTVTVIGGTAPYTYLWSRVSGDAQIGPINGISASTRFSATMLAGTGYAATYKCTVTDALAASVDSNNITINLDCF